MTYDREEVKQLFNTLEKTSGVLHAFLIANRSNMYTSSEQIMSNDSVELKIFMEAMQFLDEIQEVNGYNFKLGHWELGNNFYSLYAVNENRLILIHYAALDWEELDTKIIDLLLTI